MEGYPFGERVDDDFAVRSQRESNAQGLLESDEVLVEVHLERGATRHCENPKVEGSDVGAKKKVVHLVVSVVVVEEARGGATSVVVGAAHKQRWWRVVRVVAELQWKHGCGYGGGGEEEDY